MSAPSPKLTFEIPAEGLSDLAILSSNAVHLKAIQDILDMGGPAAFASELTEKISQELNLDEGTVASVLAALYSLRSLMRTSRLSATELFDAISRSIESQSPPGWKEVHLEAWRNARGPITAALSQTNEDDALSIQSKGRELTYLHETILRSARIITELRPVYNRSGDKVLSNVLISSLYLRFRSKGIEGEMELAMDAKDLSELRSQCERAERKSVALEKQFKELGLTLIVAGRRTNDREDQ